MKTNSFIKYYIYLRKSSEGEDRQVQSIERQSDEISRMITNQRIQVVETFEECRSAKVPHNRPEFDKMVNRYRNGGSFTSNINSTFTPKDILNFTGSFTFNRFANPQGFARWSWSMNVGVQRKFFDKKLTVTANIIDPFVQENRSYTYGTNFILKNYSTAQTRNFRLSVGYSFTKTAKKNFLLPKK